MLLVFYFFLKKLFGETIALLGFIFIGLSPIIFGISLIINPDSLLWIFLPLSLLSYFVFKKEEKVPYLWASGIFMGLSLLTKYVANILYIFFFMLPFLEYIFLEKKPALTSYLKKAFLNYATMVLISMAIFFFLYPASWVDFDVLLKGTFLSKAFETTWPLFAGIFILITIDIFALKNKATQWVLNFVSKHRNLLVQTVSVIFLFAIAFVLLDTYAGMKPFDFVSILSSPKGIGARNIFESFAGAILADTYSLIFGICPFALAALIFALLMNLKKKISYTLESCIVFYFTIFILLYYFASSVNEVAATVRCQITLYPLAFIISAIGVFQIISLEKVKRYIPHALAIILTFAISLIGVFSIRPFYFAFASPLLPQKYLLNYKDMGDSSYEAAKYLNSLP
jgi:4-amino-4-deoxy-L-arabinose transferase-like glycosyltransferase